MLVSMSSAPLFLKLLSSPLILSQPLGDGPRNSFTRDSAVTPSSLRRRVRGVLTAALCHLSEYLSSTACSSMTSRCLKA